MKFIKLSEFKGKIILGVVLAVIIAVGLAGATMLLTPQLSPTSSQQSSTTQVLSGQSVMVVQLTDPPIVPSGTTALNLTYSGISLLASEPVTSTFTTTSVSSSDTITSTITSTVTTTKSGVMTQPQSVSTGQSGTVNLLRLQNISETLASANLPNGSTIYSVSFDVSSISIAINGSTYAVTLATGGNTLLVTLARPATLQGTSAMLVDLTPTIVNTTSGYQMIPSAVGIVTSNVSGQEQHIGHEQSLSGQDNQEIHQAMGQANASLVSLSVSGNVTTLKVLVNNTGNGNFSLVAIGVSGNFTTQVPACSVSSSTTSNHRGDDQTFDHQHCGGYFGPHELVFFPNSTLTAASSSSSCETGTIGLSFGSTSDHSEGGNGHLQLSPGQCVVLTFSGTISYGNQAFVVVPSTASGQQYLVHVIATNNAQLMLNCTLPVAATSCMPLHNDNQHNGGD